MKIIKYNLCTKIKHIISEEGIQVQEVLSPVMMPYSEDALEIARRESYNGEEPEIFDDGRPEPTAPIDENITWDAMAEAIREGVNEI